MNSHVLVSVFTLDSSPHTSDPSTLTPPTSRLLNHAPFMTVTDPDLMMNPLRHNTHTHIPAPTTHTYTFPHTHQQTYKHPYTFILPSYINKQWNCSRRQQHSTQQSRTTTTRGTVTSWLVVSALDHLTTMSFDKEGLNSSYSCWTIGTQNITKCYTMYSLSTYTENVPVSHLQTHTHTHTHTLTY